MDPMQPTLNDFFAPWKVSFDKSAAVWAKQFETAERIGSANASALKAVFQVPAARKNHEAKEQEDVLAFGRSLAQLMTEAATTYSGFMSQLAVEANEELSTLAIKYVNKWSDAQVNALDKMADKAPIGVDTLLQALSQLVSTAAANQAYLLETFISRTNATEQSAMKDRKKDLPAPVESR